jgi:hypothetical protein
LSNLHLTAVDATSSNAYVMSNFGVGPREIAYVEINCNLIASDIAIGIRRSDESTTTVITNGKTCAMRSTGANFTGDTGATAGTAFTFATGDRMALVLNGRKGTLHIGKNNTFTNQGSPSSGVSPMFSSIPFDAGTRWHFFLWANNDASGNQARFVNQHAAGVSDNRLLYRHLPGFPLTWG